MTSVELFIHKPSVGLIFEPVVYVDEEWLLDEVPIRDVYGEDALIFYGIPYEQVDYGPYAIKKASLDNAAVKAAYDVAMNKLLF